MTNIVTLLILFQTNTVNWTNGDVRGEVTAVAEDHAIRYEMHGQTWWVTNFDVQQFSTEKRFRRCNCWEPEPDLSVFMTNLTGAASWNILYPTPLITNRFPNLAPPLPPPPPGFVR